MIKIITPVILFLVAFAHVSFGQGGSVKTAAPPETTKYLYCELIQQDRYINPTVTTTFVNFGSKSSYPKQNEERTHVRTLTDGMDALNYMSEKGWELVTKNVREISNIVETVYVLRKKAN